MLVHSIRPLLLALSVCLLAASAPLMAAVSYTTGEWKNISPSAVNINDKFGCNDIRIDPSNPNILYTCWDEQGLHKSTNGGETWQRIGPFDSPLHMRVNPTNGNHLYLVQGVRGDTMGFWVSTDGGANWTRPQGFTNLANNIGVNRNDGGKWDYDLYDLAVDPTDFNHVVISWHTGWNGYEWSGSDHNVWVGDNWGAGVFESFDGGSNWTKINPHPGMRGTGNSVLMLYNPAKNLGMDRKTWLLGTQQSGLWRTTNGGGSWTQVSTLDMTHGGMQILTTADGTLYTGCSQGVLVSTDNGATWTVRNGGNGLNMVAGYFTVLSDGARLYAQPGVWRGNDSVPWYTSTDGNSWSAFSSQTFNGGAYNGVYDAANGILYSANWGSGAWGLKVSGGSTPPVATAPSISAQPANASVTAGQTAIFSVTASGSGTLSYQWQRNGTAISGATGASYTTPATSTGDHGATYRVVVTGSGGSTTSAQATLTVTTAPGPTPPPAGGVIGTLDPRSYGTFWWLRDQSKANGWVEISTPIMTMLREQNKDSGSTNSAAVTVAANGDVILVSRMGVLRSRDHGTTWTPLDGDDRATRASNDTGYPETAGSIIADPEDSSRVAYLWFRGASFFTDGTGWFRPKGPGSEAYPGYDMASIDWTSASPQLFIGPRHGAGPIDITRDGGQTYESQPKFLNATGDAGPGSGDCMVCVVDANVIVYNQGSDELANNVSTAPKGLFRSTDQGRSWTKIRDGIPSASKNPVALRNGTVYFIADSKLWISRDKGLTWSSRAMPITCFQGPIMFGNWTNGSIGGMTAKGPDGVVYSKDEGQSWITLISGNEFPTKFDAGIHGPLYSANATNWLYHADNLDYKYGGGIWSYNAETNVIYCSAGGPVLRKQLSGTPPGPAAAGSSGTPPPTSTVPTIQTHPTSQAVNAGQTATFSVSASGTPSPSYQWQRNGANIVGATAASYTTPATVIGDHGVAFRVIVSNSAGAVTSSAATLTVTNTATAPTITTQPVAASVTTGQTATFTVAASGTGPLTYQWQRNGTNISGATAASYTTSATVLADSGASFRVIVTNGTGSTTSNVATLTVTGAATGGGTAGLLGRYYPSINFTGTPVERVDAQINFNWSPVGHGGTGSPGISGVGPERFTVRWTGTLTATTSGPYTFVVICDDGALLSLNGTVVIDAWSGPLWTKVKTTTPVTLTAGVPVAIQLDYLQGDGGARIELQWAPGSSDWDSATIPAANLSAATSSVPVVIAPAISAQPVSAAIIVGQVATFSVTAIGTAALSYQWQRQGTNIDGANGSSYTTPTAVLADDGALFRVVVSNTAGSVTSSAATLRVTAGTPPPDTTPPATPPAPTVAGNGSTTPTLSGTTESGATLTIRADGVVIGVAHANGTGQWSFPASGLPAGSHIITVTATDAAGNASAASPSLTITVGDGAPPTGGGSSTPPTTSNAGSSGGAGCGMGSGLAGIGLLLVGASWLRRLA